MIALSLIFFTDLLKTITLPITEQAAGELVIGDQVLLSGIIFTARDLANKYLYEEKPRLNLRNGAIYHCGPIVVTEKDRYRVLAAGPTTSIRQEPFTPALLKHYGLKIIIGKGGMGAATAQALKEAGGVYLQAVGGAAQVLASKIVEIKAVHFLELGEPEAMWELAVKDFPAVVAMDSKGGSLYAKISADSEKKLQEFNLG